ncbi:B12-binding domain-containing radical SAM protein [uncultured Desulfobacter sp.]|uniref:B12-binding domain-containing radical SAM protein n=1 Tax=uncultured Desulfobacter sp. TaxID=240139 RepID=UPI002AAB5274|nr:cobalamin-dependent protein [uncultured Desulfobacter sp.]
MENALSHGMRMPCKNIIQRVLLVQPPAFSNNLRTDMNPNIPLGLAYIGAVLEKGGYDVSILDALIEGFDREERVSSEKIRVGLSSSDIENLVRRASPDVVGISSMFTSQRKNVHELAGIVKKVNPKIPVIIGGAHPTAVPDALLEDSNIDVLVMGEGENTIIPLLECIENGRDFSNLDGVAYRDSQGRFVFQPKTSYIRDLDSIPFPARHLLPMEKYFSVGIRHGGYGKGKRSISIITSRGCPYRCNFCTAHKVFTRRPRLRSAENVLTEINQAIKAYNIDEIFFEDDQLLSKRSRILELLDGLRKFELLWDTPNGVSPWLLTDEVLKKMRESGCYRVNLAVESGSQDVLKNMINKPVHLEKVPKVVQSIRKFGMTPGMFIVAGNIGRERVETLEEVRESFQFARKVRIFPHVSILTAYPGAEVLSIAEEKGYLVPGFDWDNLVINKPQLQTPEWTPAQLKRVVDQEMVKTRWWLFLASPKMSILNVIKSFIRNPIQTTKEALLFIKRSIFT